MTITPSNEKIIRIVFTAGMVLVAAIGFLSASIFLFIWSASEPNILFPAIAFTVIVGGMMAVVFSIIVHEALGMGLRGLVRTLVFRAQYWTLGKNVKDDR